MELRSTLKTLGNFELVIGDCVVPPLPTHKARALVAFLVGNRGHDISRERLLELFWSEFEAKRAREGLRTALSTVRHALRSTQNDPDAILYANKSIVRWCGSTDFDAERFVELSERDDLASLDAALQLYGGDFLEGGYEEWAVSERERVASAYEKALAKIVAQNKDAQAARRLLERNPFNKDAYECLIDVELAADRPTAAGELLKRYRAAMAQIGSEVSAAIEERCEGVVDLPIGGGEISVPFVARTEELQRFTSVFQEQIGREGFVALVGGEPGIGKTSLLARASEIAREAGLRSLLVRGGDDPRPLGSWRGLYQRLTGRDLDQLAEGPSVEITTAAARDIVEGFGKPAVLFVDDAQELTGDSFAIFTQIVRVAKESGHAVIAAVRPEARERIEVALSGISHEVVTLRPLERADVGAAVALTIDSITPEFADVLYDRSGGNPLFLKSLLQSLVQGDAVRRDRGRWRVVRQLREHIELPRDLRTSIETRLHAAGEDAAVVACALALEPSATAEDLAAALEYSEARVLDGLDELTRYGLIREGSEHAQFSFVHDLLREVSACVLNPGRRVGLHRAFAYRFERSDLPEAMLRLARHSQAAGLNFSAAQAYLAAAQAALKRHAYHDAIECCRDGALIMERVAANREINVVLSALARIRAEAATLLGETAQALEAADEAVRQARASEQAIEIVRALAGRAALHGSLADGPRQLRDALEAAEIARDAGDPRARGKALVQAATAMLINGAAADSVALAREAHSLAQQHDDVATEWTATTHLLKAQIYQWHFDAAASGLRNALPAAERIGKSAEAELRCIQASYDYLTDQLDSALANAQIAIAFESSPLTFFTSLYLQGIVARERGDPDAVLTAVRKCRSVESIAKVPPCATALVMLETDALLQRGASGDGEAAVASAATLDASSLTIGIIGWSDCSELTRARVQPTRTALRRALDKLEENAQRLLLDCDRAFGRLATAAREAGELAIYDRAAKRSAYYHTVRVASAAKAGKAPIPLVSR